MSFSFPIRSKQEEAKIALNNARIIQLAKLRQLQLYEAIHSKINNVSSNDVAQKLYEDKARENAILKHNQEEAKKAADAAEAQAQAQAQAAAAAAAEAQAHAHAQAAAAAAAEAQAHAHAQAHAQAAAAAAAAEAQAHAQAHAQAAAAAAAAEKHRIAIQKHIQEEANKASAAAAAASSNKSFGINKLLKKITIKKNS